MTKYLKGYRISEDGEKEAVYGYSGRNNTASSRKRGMKKPNASNRKRMEKKSRRTNRRK